MAVQSGYERLLQCILPLLAFAALLQGVTSQSSSSGAAQTATLQPMQKVVYRITTVQKQANGQLLDPDLQISLSVLTGGHAGMYCNPGWAQGTVSTTNFPNVNNAYYASGNSKGINLITISRESSNYRPPANATSSYTPTFICSVISQEAARSIEISWSYMTTYASPVLVQSETAAVQAIFKQCCNSNSSCSYWKSQNAAQGQVVTNLCSFQNQACTSQGNLQTLDLSGTGLSCGFPSQAIQQFGSLQYLVMGSNPGLTGGISGILEGLSGLGSLLAVFLEDNTGLSGQLSSGTSQGACALPESLETLAIQNTSLSGSLPSCIFTNSTIYNLQLDTNQLSGSIPDRFSDSSYLQVLTLSSNKLTGTFPNSMSNANALYQLDLSYNNLTGGIPAGLGNLPLLQTVNLRNNNLSGTIPGSFVTNPNLESLVLVNNQLTALGSSWLNTSASSLVNSTAYVITLESNKLQGSFPQALAFMPRLQGISLAKNNFSGSLPSSSAIFSSLLALNVSHNSFTGSIPPQLASMEGFQANAQSTIGIPTLFDLSSNQLSGSLPAFLANGSVPAPMRSYVRLAGNKLTSNCGNTSYNYVSDLQLQCQALTAPAPAPAGSAVPPAHAPSPAAAVQRAAAQQKGGSSLSGGAVAGIVVGVLLALVLAGALFLASSKRRRERALASLPGRQQSGFGQAARKGFARRPSGAPFLQSNALGFARFDDADMNRDDASRGAEVGPEKEFRLFGI